MKRILFLLIVSMFVLVSTVEAKENSKSTKTKQVSYNYNHPISFIEKGIQFHVFLDGDFDFNSIHNRITYYDYNGRRTRRVDPQLRIYRDYKNRIKRVGNVSISYDYKGNVKRIGSVKMKYRFDQLVKIGHLRIAYRFGEPEFHGYVKRYDHYYNDSNIHLSINLGRVYEYNDRFFYGRYFRNNYRKYKEDRNYYYYKSNSKREKDQFIKRRKTTRKVEIKSNKRDSNKRQTEGLTERKNRRN